MKDLYGGQTEIGVILCELSHVCTDSNFQLIHFEGCDFKFKFTTLTSYRLQPTRFILFKLQKPDEQGKKSPQKRINEVFRRRLNCPNSITISISVSISIMFIDINASA